jgi:hypothetical protein
MTRVCRAARLVVLATAFACGAVLAQPKSDWETEYEKRNWKEAEIVLPAFPKREDFIEFAVSASSDFHFYIDKSSISVKGDGVVRYTLVARSPAGVENVSYEGIRCEGGEFRIYAFGNPDRSWRTVSQQWRPIAINAVQRWHQVLRREYFCPMNTIIYDAPEGVDALMRGGNRKLKMG